MIFFVNLFLIRLKLLGIFIIFFIVNVYLSKFVNGVNILSECLSLVGGFFIIIYIWLFLVILIMLIIIVIKLILLRFFVIFLFK